METWVDPSKRFSMYLVTFVPSNFMEGGEWKPFTSSAFAKAFLHRATKPRSREARRNRNVPDHDRVTIYANSLEDALEARNILYDVLRARGHEGSVVADIARPMQVGSTKKVSKTWTTFSNTPPAEEASAAFAPGEGESLLPRGLLNLNRSRKRKNRKGTRTKRMRRLS